MLISSLSTISFGAVILRTFLLSLLRSSACLFAPLFSLSTLLFSKLAYLPPPPISPLAFRFPVFLARFQRFRAGHRELRPGGSPSRCPSREPGAALRFMSHPPRLHLAHYPGHTLGSGRGHVTWLPLWNRWASRAARTAPRRAAPSAPPAAGRPFDVAGPAGMQPGYQSPSWIPKVSA